MSFTRALCTSLMRMNVAKCNVPNSFARSLHVTSVRKDSKPEPEYSTYERYLFELRGFHKYGLLCDDLLTELDVDVAEALRRLPEELRMARTQRAIRAQVAEISHSILPRNQWTKIEDDHYYLQPYLHEVIKEREEREAWDATH